MVDENRHISYKVKSPKIDCKKTARGRHEGHKPVRVRSSLRRNMRGTMRWTGRDIGRGSCSSRGDKKYCAGQSRAGSRRGGNPEGEDCSDRRLGQKARAV